MKKSNWKPRITTRIESPRAGKDRNGKPALLCPFCAQTHALIPGVQSGCGTDLQMRAVQTVYKAKFIKEMKCAKCGEGGGEMVRFQNAFVHIHDCAPGVVTLSEPPDMSFWARGIYMLPLSFKKRIEKYTGKVMPIDEVMPDGTRTGKTLGYFFLKGQSAHAQHPQTIS